jgi:hypothetical protein
VSDAFGTGKYIRNVATLHKNSSILQTSTSGTGELQAAEYEEWKGIRTALLMNVMRRVVAVIIRLSA